MSGPGAGSKSKRQDAAEQETSGALDPLRQISDPLYQKEAAEIVERYRPLVEPLGLALGPLSEVVLHDFSKLPNSIVAISGNLSGRLVGGPSTDFALKNLASERPKPYEIGYETIMANGRICRSSSIHLFGSSPVPVGSLCINSDVSAFVEARSLLDALISIREPSPAEARPVENFRQNIEEVSTDIISDAIRATGVAVDAMSRKHKVAVVAALKDRGFFLLRDGIDLAGTALGVSRFTIYKYLNDLEEQSA
jgi:predicted transcriptional regulator YheO